MHGIKKIGSSALLADATYASKTEDLGLVGDMKRAADALGGEIDRGAVQRLEVEEIPHLR